MQYKARILDIIEETTADGEGLRTAIYFAGCQHYCKGCHNPQSWDMNGGYEVTLDYLMDIINDDEFSDVTFSGGDPLYQCDAVTELARRIKEECDPQEVYFWEFNNHETPYGWDGDIEVMRIIVVTWGYDVAIGLKRYCRSNDKVIAELNNN